MSAGRFERSFYESNAGDIYPCRVQPETITAQNPAAAGPATEPTSAKMRGGRRSIGMNARYVSLEWDGAPPVGYDDRTNIRVPILTPTAYDALNLNDTFTYLGATATVIGLNPERRR